jgi:hypothetical protein
MLLNKQATANFQLVQVLIPANSPNQRFNIPDQPLLRDKAIEKIEVYNNLLIGKAPNGTNCQLPTNSAYLTFADQSGFEFIQNQLYWEFNGLYGNANADANSFTINGTFNIGLRKIVFPKSFVTFNSSNPSNNPYTILLGIYYR